MNFPPHWARAEADGFLAWGWSNLSLEEARARAGAAAENLARRFRLGPTLAGRYSYSERALREPVLRDILSDDGQRIAVVTRNAPGCRVLNTVRVMFLDVDLPQPFEPSLIQRLLGIRGRPPAGPTEEEVLARAQAWARGQGDWTWRIYRTHSGLRLLATHDLFEARAAIASRVFEALGVDPMYRRLCAYTSLGERSTKRGSCSAARNCPEFQVWMRDSRLAGKMTVRWVIGAKGTVTDAEVTDSELNNGAVEACVLKIVRSLKFREPPGGGFVTVSYPIHFKAA